MKKQRHFNEKLAQHFSDVRSANGQPLNDKRNGIATLNRWERQNKGLQSLQNGMDLTTRAIERERSAIVRTAGVALPDAIKRGVADGVLLQWRKHPNTFFVSGVDKARIVLLPDGSVAHRYVSSIKDIAQHKKFAKVYNALKATMDAEERG